MLKSFNYALGNQIFESFITDRTNELHVPVEVFSSHPLLQAGCCLVDAPGTGETEDITGEVYKFLEKHFIVTVIYVCDGKSGFRYSVSAVIELLSY